MVLILSNVKLGITKYIFGVSKCGFGVSKYALAPSSGLRKTVAYIGTNVSVLFAFTQIMMKSNICISSYLQNNFVLVY